MRENEFEKQVKEKMDDFHLRPSPEVWADVERRIRKEKKRRIIFWWPLLFILLAGGIGAGIWFMNKKERTANDTDTVKGTIIEKPAGIETPKQPEQGLVPPEKNDTGWIPATTDTNAVIIKPGTTVALSNNKLTAVNSHVQEAFSSKAGSVKKKKTKKNDEVSAVTIEPAEVKTTIPDVGPVTVNNIAAEKKIPVAELVVADQQTKTTMPDSLQTVPAAVVSATVKPADSAMKATVSEKQKKKPGKWNWELNASAGRSSVVNGIGAGLFKSGRLEVADALGGVPALATYRSTPIYYGTSAGIGVNIQRPVSKKLQLGFGLSYNYLSNRTNVGNRVDSSRVVSNNFSTGAAVSNFYQPSNSAFSNKYRNQYHFVSLSADLSWRIIDGKKFKLDWKNSLQYGLLAGSNMLHFDRNLPGYYQDNTLLNKGLLFLSTGFSMPVSSKVKINPFVNYSLTPVLKKTNSDKTYYADFGIRIHFLLNKK